MQIVDLSREEALAKIAPTTRQAVGLRYVEAVRSLKPDRALELRPDDGESLRSLKLRLSRASKAVGIDVAYADSDAATLIVWLNGSRAQEAVAS